jgi:hypothetical protein
MLGLFGSLVVVPWLLTCRAHEDTQTHARLTVGSLSIWSPLGQGTEGSAGIFDFLDDDAPTENGYYRVRSAAP